MCIKTDSLDHLYFRRLLGVTSYRESCLTLKLFAGHTTYSIMQCLESRVSLPHWTGYSSNVFTTDLALKSK